MQIQNFIILDEQPRGMFDRKESVKTISGQVYLQLGKPLPIILRGTGCIGIGLVTELRITEETTTIKFTAEEVGKDFAIAYYALYQNQISTDDSTDDPYEQTDQIIPGAMGHAVKKSRKKHMDNSSFNPYTGNTGRGKSLVDYGGDDIHW